jgi:hypothetical protein
MVKEHILGLIKELIEENGKIIRWMERENLFGLVNK